MDISNKIKELRRKKGLTQKQLADKTGLATITIQNYEGGKYKPKYETACKIANALEIPISDILDSDILDQTYIDLVERSINVTPSVITSHYPVGSTVKDLDDLPFDNNIICTDEKELILNYRMLNSLGRVVAVERVKELTEINKYTEQHEIKKDI